MAQRCGCNQVIDAFVSGLYAKPAPQLGDLRGDGQMFWANCSSVAYQPLGEFIGKASASCLFLKHVAWQYQLQFRQSSAHLKRLFHWFVLLENAITPALGLALRSSDSTTVSMQNHEKSISRGCTSKRYSWKAWGCFRHWLAGDQSSSVVWLCCQLHWLHCVAGLQNLAQTVHQSSSLHFRMLRHRAKRYQKR